MEKQQTSKPQQIANNPDAYKILRKGRDSSSWQRTNLKDKIKFWLPVIKVVFWGGIALIIISALAPEQSVSIVPSKVAPPTDTQVLYVTYAFFAGVIWWLIYKLKKLWNK